MRASTGRACCRTIRSSNSEGTRRVHLDAMCATRVSTETLRRLEPIRSLSPARVQELEGLCYLERVGPTVHPFPTGGIAGEAVYLLSGELALTYEDGAAVVIVGGSEE